MGFYATDTLPAQTDPRPKNRVVGSRRFAPDRARRSAPQPPETTSETTVTVTITVSGLSCWLSRDPIEERGGYNLYAFVYNNPPNAIDPDGRGVLEWVLTGEWNPQPDVLDAAVEGWTEGLGRIPFTDMSLGKWAYTGQWDADTATLQAALNSQEMAQYASCYTKCVACQHKKFLRYLEGGSVSTILHTGVPRPLAEFLIRQKLGGHFWKSGFRLINIGAGRAGLGRAAMLTKHADAFKRAGAAGKVVRVAAIAGAIMEMRIAYICWDRCKDDPCYECDK